MSNLVELLKQVEDPRDKRGVRYSLHMLLICLVYGVLCGLDNSVDIAYFIEANFKYFKETYGLPKPPSHDTFSRILGMVEVSNLTSCLGEFLSEKYPEKYKKYGGKKVLHIDGKAMKATTRKCYGQDTVYYMNSQYEGGTISLYSEKIEDKKNEIAAIPDFLDNFNLKDTIVTIDAIGLNTKIIDKILEKKGSFLIPVKENQKGLYKAIVEEVDRLNKEGKFKSLDGCEINNKSHGRIEKRKAHLLTDTEFIVKNNNIPKVFMNIGSILVIEKKVESKVKGEWQEISNGISFAVTNLTDVSVENLLTIKMSHWSIEASHWLLDVQFNEDKYLGWKNNSGSNMSCLRCFALAIKEAVKKKKDSKLTTSKFLILNQYDFSRIEEYLFTYCID